jgi:hypothetical protein
MDFENLPVKVALADTDGINNAYDSIVWSREGAGDLERLLREQPRDVIRRVLSLNRYQRASLGEMTDEEVTELVQPVLELLRSDDPTRMRGLRLAETIVRQSPIKVKCTIEIDW